MKVAIIGGGNLGASIAEGLAQTDLLHPSDITVTRRKLDKLAHLAEKGIRTQSDNRAAVASAHVVIVAVKPYQIKAILREIAPAVRPEQLLVSVVTGVSMAEMQEALETEAVLFRAMPNTAIAIQESMTCIAAKNATPAQQQVVVELFSRLGKAVVIDEELMQAATVLAACGIAYAMRFIRAASQGGIEIGFSADTAQFIAAQTVKGAASLLLERGLHPESEIDKVTTPQGCTIVGLNEMEHQGFSSALIKGVRSSYDKIAFIKG
jgi:pyrroline-5-carboxylate reductase